MYHNFILLVYHCYYILIVLVELMVVPLASEGHIFIGSRPCITAPFVQHSYMPIRAEDLYRLQVFDHRCVRTIGNICWKQKITNELVHRRIFISTDKAKSLANIIQQARLRWLGHVFRMDQKRLTQVMFATRGSSWKKSRGG